MRSFDNNKLKACAGDEDYGYWETTVWDPVQGSGEHLF